MVIAAISVTLRPDGILLFIAFIIFEILFYKTISIKKVLFFLVPLTAYLLLLYFYYGTIIPQSVVAKSNLYNSFSEQWIFLKKFFISPQSFILGILFFIGGYYLIKIRTGLIILIWGMIYAVSFSSFTTWWPWYLHAFGFSYCFIISFGIYKIYTWLNFNKYILATVIIITYLFPAVLFFDTIVKVNNDKNKMGTYFKQSEEIADWLSKNVGKNQRILIEPLGLVGYLAFNNRFTDYPGLVSKEITNSLSRIGRKVYGFPMDYEAMRQIIADLKPEVLRLREKEYLLLNEKKVIENYKIEFITNIDFDEYSKATGAQNILILKEAQEL